MRLTKYGHSCVLVEVEDAGMNRVALFDPGVWSDIPLVDFAKLDDVFISHIHEDHLDIAKVHEIVQKFPDVRITAPTEVVNYLRHEGLTQAADIAPAGAAFFASPHEGHLPFIQPPEEIGVHLLDVYSHPGDSHSFAESKAVLAMPVQAPWGSTIDAVDLLLKLKPQYVLPVHDWHWQAEARTSMYDRLEALLKTHGITFLKPQDGVAIDVQLLSEDMRG